jgi:hypothetical protein
MANNNAYTFKINPNGSGGGEDNLIHQTSPAWVLSFVRWENRDTHRTKTVSATEVRDPLVVENDCIQLNVTTSKGSLTPSMSATLVQTDVNYLASVAPGDFVFVNMLNWLDDARRVADQARARKAINGVKDGFKGIFKVQGVRRVITTDPNTGTKIVLVRINGYAFTEFNNTIYFNPYLLEAQDQNNQLLFASYIGNDWASLVNEKGLVNVQDILAVLIQSLIGTGISEQGRTDKNGTVKSPNVHFFIPQLVGNLLGITGAKAAKDIYSYLFGIQSYASGSAQSLGGGMNPQGLVSKFGNFRYTGTPCQGDSLVKPEYWNQVKTWAILNQYTNAPLNELYTCFRVTPTNRVMPTLVFRQVPFTTEDFANGNYTVTRFMNLPRWKISPALVIDQDIGRDEAARVNFVQYFGRSSLGVAGSDIAQEIAQGNYVYDIDDVQRSGLRPYIVTTQFDEPTTVSKAYRSPFWAKIMGDALIGGHLKFNGTLFCAGLVDPIAVGDNLEFDGIVYHIEQITHACSISVGDGRKVFRTTINLSSGLSVESSSQGTKYPEMTYTNANDERNVDWNGNQILPGVSESQDVHYRNQSLDEPESPSKPFTQPNGNIVRQKPSKGND